MKAKYIYFPALALFVTLCACFVFFFGCYIFFVTSTGLIPFGQQPVWMRAFSHFALPRTAIRLELAVATVGSALTLWLLLKTEVPEKARIHFKNLGIGILLGAAAGFLLALSISVVTVLRIASSPQGLAQLGSITNFARMAFGGSALAGIGFGVFTLIALAVPYALFTLVSRARQPTPAPPLAAAQSPHNPREYFHHTL